MLVQPPIEELLPKADSRYSLAMLVAKRTRQLVDGAQPMVPETTPNLVTLACEEVVVSKVIGVKGMHNPFVPLRPEIEEARRLAKELAETQAALDAFPDLIDMKALTANPPEEQTDESTGEGDAEGSEEVSETNTEASSEISDEEVTDDGIEGSEEASEGVSENDTEESAEKKISEEIPDVSEEDIKDLTALDGAETEETE